MDSEISALSLQEEDVAPADGEILPGEGFNDYPVVNGGSDNSWSELGEIPRAGRSIFEFPKFFLIEKSFP